jgi:hypothetical protein
MVLMGVITALMIYVIWSWKPSPPNKRPQLQAGEEIALKEVGDAGL